MSTEISKNNHKEEKNDWDDEDDDNWDDWGDAEENAPELAPKTQRNLDKETPISQEKEKVLDNTTNETERKTSWGMWGSKLLSTATEGFGNITSQVSQTLDQVIGVPGPEELARMNSSKNSQTLKSSTTEEADNESESSAGFGSNLVSGVTNLGSKVITTGLGTLEGIGKKTMDLLQENDPLLKNKRKLLGLETEKPNLSEVLKEAKRDAETLENFLEQMQLEKTKSSLRFETLFENNCGLMHYEALEILSKESKLKIETLLEAVSGKALDDLKETLEEVKELSELEETDGESEGDYESKELLEKLSTATVDMDLPLQFDDIAKLWSNCLEWLETESSTADSQEVFKKGITNLAEFCALEMNKLHKIAELLLVKEHHSTANEVDGLIQLCKQFNSHLSGHTTRFAGILTARNEDKDASNLVTTMFAELLSAMGYINKAFKLFLPILQLGAV